MYLSLTCRAIYDLYQNLYDTWFKGQSQETIEKVKAFFQTQVSNINTAVNFSNWLSLSYGVQPHSQASPVFHSSVCVHNITQKWKSGENLHILLWTQKKKSVKKNWEWGYNVNGLVPELGNVLFPGLQYLGRRLGMTLQFAWLHSYVSGFCWLYWQHKYLVISQISWAEFFLVKHNLCI